MNNDLIIGWDLGGAHVKAVLLDANGLAVQALQVACPLWRGMDHLTNALDAIMAAMPHPARGHAVTMTGELADIFSSRAHGVQSLVDAMVRRFGLDAVQIYAAGQGLQSPTAAPQFVAAIASANWHASATYLAGQIDEGLLIDIGSTTADLILLRHGQVMAQGLTDAERMRHGELIYSGVVRTPVMAVAKQVPFAGAWQGLAAEHFATMADVYRLTGDLSDDCDMADTADGMGKTPTDSARRLARMLGRDEADADMERWRQLALAIKHQQLRTLQQGVALALSRGLLDDAAPVLGAGVGRFLARELSRNMGLNYVDVSHWVTAAPAASDWAASCLPAYAVARLAQHG